MFAKNWLFLLKIIAVSEVLIISRTSVMFARCYWDKCVNWTVGSLETHILCMHLYRKISRFRSRLGPEIKGLGLKKMLKGLGLDLVSDLRSEFSVSSRSQIATSRLHHWSQALTNLYGTIEGAFHQKCYSLSTTVYYCIVLLAKSGTQPNSQTILNLFLGSRM